jgi:hypothetical protein
MQRTPITIGLLIAPAGVLWPRIAKPGLGRLPGDLVIDRPGRRPIQVARRKISV